MNQVMEGLYGSANDSKYKKIPKPWATFCNSCFVEILLKRFLRNFV